MSSRIGMITFHESENYGTVLQAFALQETIKTLGYIPEIVNYQRKSEIIITKISFKERVLKGVSVYKGLKIFYFPWIRQYSRNKAKKFDLFRNEYLNYSLNKFNGYYDLKKTNDYYNCYLCGSDMIWSLDRSEDIGIYFLNFASASKRIAYAPSFGSSKIIEKKEHIYVEYLDGIRFLSCRESSGVNLIRRLTSRDAKLVVDPTLLISKEKWTEFFPIKTGKKQLPYILCYLFEGMNEELKNIVEHIKQKLKLDIRYIPMSANDFIENKKGSSQGIGPKEFTQLFKNAEFIITNSYHGLLFSLIFNLPFYVIKRNKKGYWAQFEDRLESLLNRLCLNNRLIENTTDISKNELLIDYKSINISIDKMRKDSLEYLSNSIKSVVSDYDES